jgi:hypothetical protein
MIDQKTFVDQTLRIAKELGHLIERNKDGLRQIGFRKTGRAKAYKTLHEGHLRDLYPALLQQAADFYVEIERVAPGRPGTVVPMRDIVAQLPK